MTKNLLTLCLAALPTLAYAHSTEADSVRHLSEVEVVADMVTKKPRANSLSRIDVPLEKLPMTISTISMKDLAKRGLYQPTDALRFATGAGLRKTYGAFLQLNVRGFDYAPIVIDGMRDERTTFNSYPLSDLSDVESIEILKGPASVLQGHSAVGGVLNITRRRASSRTEASARLDYGSFNQLRAQASIGGKLNQVWSNLTGISYGQSDGWRLVGDKRFKVFSTFSGRWEGDELDLRISYHNDFYGTEIGLPAVFNTPVYSAANDQIHLEPGQLQPGIKRDARYNNESDEMYNRNLNLSLSFTHTFSSWLKLREQIFLNHDDIDYFSTEELSYRTSDKPDYPHYYMSGKKRVYVDLAHVQLTYPLRFEHVAKTAQNQLSLEAKLKTWGIRHNLSLGHAASYMRRVSYTGYKFAAGTPNPDLTGAGLFSVISAYEPKSAGPIKTKFSRAVPLNIFSQGIFVQDVLEFSPMLQAMLAARYDYYRAERGGNVEAVEGKAMHADPTKYSQATSQALTYRAGLVFAPRQGTSIYGSYANFYKPYQTVYSPNVTYINKAGEEFIPKPDGEIFAPMQGYQVELGSRVQLCSWLELTAAAYYIQQHNELKRLGEHTVKVDGADVKKTITGQVGNSHSKGFEIDLKAAPIQGLELALGYSYTDARVGKISSNKYLSEEVLSGNRLAYIPRDKFYSLGSYLWQHGVLKGLGLHYSVSYTGERFRNLTNKLSFDPFTQIDLGAMYELRKGLVLGADVYNVLNTKTYQESLGLQLVPNEPTSFRVSLRYTL